MHVCRVGKKTGFHSKVGKEHEMKKSRINRIPLNERLDNINKGYAGDEAYNTEAIIRFANIPIMEYLGAFHVECGGMLRSLHIKKADAQHMTYQDIAKRIYIMYHSEEDKRDAIRAMNILVKPFNRCYEERNQYYG